MKNPCGCCAGVEIVTPQELVNRPGLSEIAYRVGTHATFLESMLARLSSAEPIVESGEPHAGVPGGGRSSESIGADAGYGNEEGGGEGDHEKLSGQEGSREPHHHSPSAGPRKSASPLSGLRTRQPDDASIALLDAWATVADVLTFYQERVANEGFLRTAVERRSVVELARLLGYRPRPGVASSVHLAFTLQSGFDVTVAVGTPAMTTPGPGELPQTFETSESLDARADWNELLPRRTRPQSISELNANEINNIYFEGVDTRLKPNDRLLLVFGDDAGEQFMRSVAAVKEDQVNKRTEVTLLVGEFSAAQFALEVQKLLQDPLKNCQGFAAVGEVGTLQGKLKESHTLAYYSSSLNDALVVLVNKSGSVQAALKDLTAVRVAAVALSSALKDKLDHPHAAFATNVEGVIDAFTAQQSHAVTVDTVLGGLSLQAKAPLAPKVTALLAADATLRSEGVETPAFKVLAEAIRALHSDWTPAINGIQDAVNGAMRKAIEDIDKAVALNPPEDKLLIDKFKAIKAAFVGVASKPVGDQMAQVEQAVADLKSAKANNAEVINLLASIQASLNDGVRAVGQKLKDASTALANHSELRLTQQDKLDDVKNILTTLRGKLSSPLRDQRTALIEAGNKVRNEQATGFVETRLLELVAALAAAPGDAVRNDLVAVIAAVTIPTVTNEPAKTHAATVSGLVQLPAGVLDAIGKADQATPALNDEVAKIDADINAVESGQDCFNDAINSLESEQSQFVLHFAQQFQTIHDQFNRSAANIPNNQPAVQALTLLQGALDPLKKKLDDLKKKLDQHDPLSETDLRMLPELVDAVNKAVKDDSASSDITRLQAAVPPTQGTLRAWFRDLLNAIKNQLDFITGSQPQPQPQQGEGKDAFSQLGDIAANLLKTTKPGTRETPDLKTAFSLGSDTVARSLLVLKPGLGVELLKGWGNIKVELPVVEVYAFRVRASLFGYNAPKLRTTDVTSITPSATGLRFTEASTGLRITEATNASTAGTGQRFTVAEDGDPLFAENSGQVDLDASYDQIVPSSWVAVQRPGAQPVFARAGQVSLGIGLSRYGMTGKTTEISLNSPKEPHKPQPWFDGRVTDFNVVRGTLVWAQAERLALAEKPITVPVGGKANSDEAKSVELDGYFDGLTAGRFVAVTGERTREDVGVEGIVATELALIAAVEQRLDASLPGDTLHTRLVFAVDLQHQYKRETVKLNANVAHATHGETQKEVLGSGDGSRRFQSFTLSKPPLTYLSKPTPSGAESALQVRVNDILWHEADNLAGLGPDDRKYIVDIEDDDTTRVVFGDGVHGSRLPTGTENVRSVYRSGIGKPGNVVASKINILSSPPLGVTAVNNPAPATGGADPETRDQARRNAPVAVLALDRLVSVRDYADFARTFAGIAKANSSLEKGTVTVTIAGSDDIPIDTGSDLFINLSASLEEFGDPHQIVKLQMRKLKILVLQMGVVINPDYDFDIVKDKIRATLLDHFGFDQQELGEPVILSRVLSVSQHVPGVEYLDVDIFGAIQEPDVPDPNKVIQAIEDLVKVQTTGDQPRPAQFVATGPNEIAYFSPALPETIALKQLVPEGNQ